jgi:hypothetical protein
MVVSPSPSPPCRMPRCHPKMNRFSPTTVHADVTDPTGETRSASLRVSIGYTSMQAVLATDRWLTSDQPVNVTITTSSLDGKPVAAEGTLKVYSLKAPKPGGESDEASTPPNDRSASSDDLQRWTSDILQQTIPFKTDETGKMVIPVALKGGAWRIELESRDRLGKAVRALHHLIVIEPESSRFSINGIPFFATSSRSSVEPGETLTAVWGSGHETARAWVEVMCVMANSCSATGPLPDAPSKAFRSPSPRT